MRFHWQILQRYIQMLHIRSDNIIVKFKSVMRLICVASGMMPRIEMFTRVSGLDAWFNNHSEADIMICRAETIQPDPICSKC